MKNWMKRLILLAAVSAAALGQAAYRQDGSIRVDHTVNSPTLSVKYAGMRAALIELRVNGKSRGSKVVNPDAKNGELEFNLDLESLDDGDNSVEITIFDGDGKVIGTQKTMIQVDQATSGAVYLQGVKSGMSIEGTIELKLGVNRDFRELYVSFFVDDEWKALKNSQPYNYYWDTTRQTNGWHLVQAWVVDESNNTFKTKKVKVYVNNPGGRTERIVAPEKTVTTKPTNYDPASANGIIVPKNAKPVVAVTTARDLKVDRSAPILSGTSGLRAPVLPLSMAAGQKNLTPTGKRLAPKPVAKAPVPPVEVKPLSKPVVKPVLPNPARPVESVTPLAKPVVAPAVQPVAPRVKPAVLVRPSVAVSKRSAISIEYGVRLPQVSTFDLMVNGKAVAFGNVRPRVTNGVPITPFRFLFEQSGGKVKWAHKTKEVRATGNGQRVYFQIGNRNASVNNLPVKLELRPFLEASRSLVPLSFITEALKVDVDYDPNTGHVLITTAKK